MKQRITSTLAATALAAGALTFTATPAGAATYTPQGAQWRADGSGATYSAATPNTTATQHAVGQYQLILGVPNTRRYDQATKNAVLRFQHASPWLRDTGRIDFPTSRALLWGIIQQEAARAGMSTKALCGHLWAESRLDPGAVGPGSIDFGVAQIVPRYRPGTNPWDVRAAMRRMASDDIKAKRAYGHWAQVAWWKPAEAKAAAAGRPSEKAIGYVQRINQAPCP